MKMYLKYSILSLYGDGTYIVVCLGNMYIVCYVECSL